MTTAETHHETKAPIAEAAGEDATANVGLSPRLLTVTEAARLLSVGRTTAYELIGAGDLEVVHIGRAARIPVDAIDALVETLRCRAIRTIRLTRLAAPDAAGPTDRGD